MTGLSATVTRKDGHHPIIFMQCGPVRYRVEPKKQALARPFRHTLIVRPTGFQFLSAPSPDARSEFHELYEALIADEALNRLICGDVIEAVRAGRSPIVLTERTEHLEHLTNILSPDVCHLIVFRGGMGRKALAAVSDRLAAIPEDEDRVLPMLARMFDRRCNGYEEIGYTIQLPASAIPG